MSWTRIAQGFGQAVIVPFAAITFIVGFVAYAISAGFVTGWVVGEELLNLGASQPGRRAP